tara:strand:+ start:7625 stop:8122 length:498 start_codon:yes stop_codon:yes gene_type:complete
MTDDFSIDLTNVEEDNDFSAMPAGQYEMVANQWNQHTSKAGNQSIKVEFDVVGPSHAGRKVWEYFTVEGNAVTVTARRVKSWRKALGLNPDATFNRESLDEMMNEPFLAKIKIEPGTDGYADSNKIADFVTKGNKLPDVEQDPKEVEAVEKTESKTSDKDYDWMK